MPLTPDVPEPTGRPGSRQSQNSENKEFKDDEPAYALSADPLHPAEWTPLRDLPVRADSSSSRWVLDRDAALTR